MKYFLLILVALQPIIDLDYLLYPILDQYHLPRISTVIRFVVIPLIMLYVFFKQDKHRLKTIVFGGIYAVLLGIYLYFHIQQSIAVYPILDLTTNFEFNVYQEIVYVATLLLPYGLIYCFYYTQISKEDVKKVILLLCGFISISIVLGDIFLFGKSTYEGYTVAPFTTWFTNIYKVYHPRLVTSKFFFNEGNTIGILMFMLLPVLFYFFAVEKHRKLQYAIGALIAVQCLAMQILGTRVATYGAVLLPATFVVYYIFDAWILKNETLKKGVIGYALVIVCLFGTTLNFAPAVENQRIDNKNDTALLHNGAAEEGRERLKEAPLIPGTKEFNDFYIFMFEQYGVRAKYASSIPKIYYLYWYNYKFDPKFWTDVIFMPVFDRVSGRQIQKIFTDYKWQNLASQQKLLGMGYSTFMNGSIVLEKDFTQQYYLLGPIGMVLTCMPWLIVTAIIGIYCLIHFKKHIHLQTMSLGIALVGGLGCAYVSGHTIDQFVTTTFMAFLVALLLKVISGDSEWQK